MYKMKKGGIVRLVATESEAERWKSLGYKETEPTAVEPAPSNDSGQNMIDPLKSMEVDGLKAFAVEKGIDIGNSTSQNGIYKKIRDALPWVSEQSEV